MYPGKHNMEIQKYLAFLAIGVAATCTNAAEISEGDFMVALPMVATATRLSQPVAESPASITIIDREMILASGFVEIVDLLRLVPGFQVGLSWRDYHSAFAYHGQSDGLSREMQVLLDGRIALGSQSGLLDWDRLGITVSDLERIEVVRGPSGAAYGSNAFSGSINLVTRSTATTPGRHLGIVTGSNDTSLATWRYTRHQDRFDYRVAATYFETEGFDNINDQVQAETIRLDGSYQLAETYSLDLHLNLGGGDSGRGGQLPPGDPAGTKDIREDSALLRWNYAPSTERHGYLQFSYIRSQSDDHYEIGLFSELFGVAPALVPVLTGGLQDGVLEGGLFDFDTNRFNLDFQQTSAFGDEIRLVWGVGIQRESITGEFSFMDNPGRWEDVKGRAHANLEKKFGQFALNAGFQFEDGDLADGDFSSRVGLNYHLGDEQTLRFSYAQGFRQPFTGEAHSHVSTKLNGTVVNTLVISLDVPKPEKVQSYELGYIASLFNERLFLETKLYREVFTRQIHLAFDNSLPQPPVIPELPGALVAGNFGATTIEGWEAGLRYRPNDQASLWLSYAYADAVETDAPNAARSFLPASGTPKRTASLLFSYRFAPEWEASLGYYYLGDMSWRVAVNPADVNFVEAYDRLDLRLARHVTINSRQLLVELIGQNLGDDYTEFTSGSEFSTRVFLRASLEFD